MAALTWLAPVLALFDHLAAALSAAGPLPFFVAMALLPAAGVPMMVFSLTAGTAFAPRMGMGAVVAAGLVAQTINLILTYWLARRALRPWLTRLVARLGYKVPRVEDADMTDLIVLLRVTPGIPFFGQNYLLGLADAPFGKYLWISCATSSTYTAAIIVFGEALRHGRARLIMEAVLVLVALTAATHLLRRHYGRKKAAA
jgi:uncharacterized membrane protein YdjX (TVP38/TMEM64 family)